METQRDAQGRWRKGASGNPKGRAKNAATADMASLARRYTKIAVETLREIATNREGASGARVAASVALLDRGWGKPVTSNVLELVSQNKNIRSNIQIEFVRAKDGRPWVNDDLPADLTNVRPAGQA